MAQLSEQELVRREKLSKLRELGIDPYPAELYPITKSTKEIKSNFTEEKKVTIAGRLMRKKVQGKLLLKFKIVMGVYKCILIEMKSVLEMINLIIMIYLKN